MKGHYKATDFPLYLQHHFFHLIWYNYSLSQNCLPIENRHVATVKVSPISKIKFPVAHITEYVLSFQLHQSQKFVLRYILLKNRSGCWTAKIIIDIATINEAFTWNFYVLYPGNAKLQSILPWWSPALIVKSWVFSRLSLEIVFFFFKIQIITFTQICTPFCLWGGSSGTPV
jgi:hypothetical protein